MHKKLPIVIHEDHQFTWCMLSTEDVENWSQHWKDVDCQDCKRIHGQAEYNMHPLHSWWLQESWSV